MINNKQLSCVKRHTNYNARYLTSLLSIICIPMFSINLDLEANKLINPSKLISLFELTQNIYNMEQYNTWNVQCCFQNVSSSCTIHQISEYLYVKYHKLGNNHKWYGIPIFFEKSEYFSNTEKMLFLLITLSIRVSFVNILKYNYSSKHYKYIHFSKILFMLFFFSSLPISDHIRAISFTHQSFVNFLKPCYTIILAMFKS